MDRSGPKVTLSLSEHSELLRAAGLDPGKHGLSDLARLLRQYRILHQTIVDANYRLSKEMLKVVADPISNLRAR